MGAQNRPLGQDLRVCTRSCVRRSRVRRCVWGGSWPRGEVGADVKEEGEACGLTLWVDRCQASGQRGQAAGGRDRVGRRPGCEPGSGRVGGEGCRGRSRERGEGGP